MGGILSGREPRADPDGRIGSFSSEASSEATKQHRPAAAPQRGSRGSCRHKFVGQFWRRSKQRRSSLLGGKDKLKRRWSSIAAEGATGSALLLARKPAEVSKIRFRTANVEVYVEHLHGCRKVSVPISSAVAEVMAAGVHPSASRLLHRGRIGTVRANPNYRLTRRQGRAGWLLTADSKAFFNFIIRQWQPLRFATSGPYSPCRDQLYMAFTPVALGRQDAARNTDSSKPLPSSKLFVKLGFRSQAEGHQPDDNDSLIGYLEKKSSHLRLTDVPGAGIYVFNVPKDHLDLPNSGRAAEASLKAVMLNTSELLVTPSGHRADVGTFSASLEFLFVEKIGGGDPKPVLTTILQRFSGNPALQPFAAVSDLGGRKRRGKKRLLPEDVADRILGGEQEDLREVARQARKKSRQSFVVASSSQRQDAPPSNLRSRCVVRRLQGGLAQHEPGSQKSRRAMTKSI